MGVIDSVVSGIDSAVDWIGNSISSAIGDLIGQVCYYIVSTLCNLVKLVYNFFAVFAGIQKVEYDGSSSYLINIFFGNRKITNIYWGMALIGIVFVFAFLLIAVIRKMFDADDKSRRSIGSILLSGGKSILMILLLSAVLSAVLNLTNLLVDRVSFMFDRSDTLHEEDRIDFSDEQYATMARVFNTIGNYSLNASYDSRYNLSSCYNEIRPDLLKLQEDGVFDFYYDETNGVTWQSALQHLVRAYDPRFEMKIDDYNDASKAILEIMEVLKRDASFAPVAFAEWSFSGASAASAPLDRVIFLSGTLDAAKNPAFNAEPSLTDGLRGPFYYGEDSEKPSIYSYDDVSDAFNIGISGISYLLIALTAIITLKNLALCIFNSIARIFNLLGLYIIAPPLIATAPLDDGEKFKQWLTSAVVQMFGIFGCIIPMRLVILFIPMIFDARLVLFPQSVVTDTLAKVLLVMGAIEAANRFGSILTGVLANNAGYEAVRAGDMKDYSRAMFGKATGAAKSAGSFAANVTGLGAAGRWAGGKISSAYSAISEKGGAVVGTVRSLSSWRSESKQHSEDESRRQRQDAVNMAKLSADERQYGLAPAEAPRNNVPAAAPRNNAPAGGAGGNGGNREIPENLRGH